MGWLNGGILSTMNDDHRLTQIERGLATLEARMDSQFNAISRQINGISERLDIHASNHHGVKSVARQGGLAAAAVTALFALFELLQRFLL